MSYHPSIAEKLSWFDDGHITDQQIAQVIARHRELAYALADNIPPHPQLTLALQDLIDCKDGAVRALVAYRRSIGNPPTPNTPELPPVVARLREQAVQQAEQMAVLRARSCPSCQSIGEPRVVTKDGQRLRCPDPWHDQPDRLPSLGEPD